MIASPPWSQFQDLHELLHVLQPSLIVGGAVRNAIMGLEISDIDIATEHSPDIVTQKARKAGFQVIPTGISHGTVTCFKDRAYEVTTLRMDKVTDGRHATVEFCNSWEEDAKRRDFTMNAIYADFDGKVYDFIDGISDLEHRILRFIGNPDDRIHEDYLRILRFFRFYAHYAQSYDADSLDACLKLAENLSKISRERCTYEFLKMLRADNPVKSIELMNHDVFTYAGLPSCNNNTVASLGLSCDAHKLSYIGKLSTFSQRHELILSRKQHKLVSQLVMLPEMYHLSDYVTWINSCHDEVLWDGIILKGKSNDSIINDLQPWMDNKFALGGRDIIGLGVDPGPQISIYIDKAKVFFCHQKSPISKDELLEYVKSVIQTR